ALRGSLWPTCTPPGAGTLQARPHDGVNATDLVVPGNWVGSAHRFRIDWSATSVAFWIDGNQVASVPVAISSSMRPMVSDFNVGGGALQVDWLRLAGYATTATFTSRVLDVGAPIAWTSASWTAQTPAGTTLAMSARFGNTPTPDAGWTSFATLPVNGGSPGTTSRYVQYQATLTGNGSV